MARRHDGNTTNYATAGTWVNPTYPFTLCAWFRDLSVLATTDDSIITLCRPGSGNNSRFHLGVRPGTGLGIFPRAAYAHASPGASTTGRVTGAIDVEDQGWYFAAAIYYSASLRGIVDSNGEVQNSTTQTIDLNQTFTVNIGTRVNSVGAPSQMFNGDIAQVAVVKRALDLTVDIPRLLRKVPIEQVINPKDIIFASNYLGRQSPDPAVIGSTPATITGTLAHTAHVPGMMLSGRNTMVGNVKSFLPETRLVSHV